MSHVRTACSYASRRRSPELTPSVTGLVENFKQLQRPAGRVAGEGPAGDQSARQDLTADRSGGTSQMLDMIEQITQREEEMIAGIDQISQRRRAIRAMSTISASAD